MEEETPKQKKFEELKDAYIKQQEELQKQNETKAKMQLMLKRLLDEQAQQRLANVLLVNPQLYTKTFNAIITLAQKGFIQGKLNEEQLKQVLMQLKENRETKIEMKRK